MSIDECEDEVAEDLLERDLREREIARKEGRLFDGRIRPAFENVDLGDYSKVRAFCEEWRVKFIDYGVSSLVWFNLEFSVWGAMRLLGGANIPKEPDESRTSRLQALDAVIDWCERNDVAPVIVPADPVASKSVGRRGRLPKAESELLETSMLAHLREHPTLADDPERLATLVGVSASTARRLIESEREKYAKLNWRE